MADLKTETQKWISSVLIMWVFKVLPDENEYKLRFAKFNLKNIDSL